MIAASAFMVSQTLQSQLITATSTKELTSEFTTVLMVLPSELSPAGVQVPHTDVKTEHT
jgi:hypothetical protein